MNRYSVDHNESLIGRRVRAFGLSDQAYEGSICTVTNVGSIRAWGEFQSISKPDDTFSLTFTTYEEIDEPTVDIAMIPVSDHDRAVEVLNARLRETETLLSRANARVEELRSRAGKWERDFGRYAERIVQEAIDREWCEEYDRIMNEIKEDLEIATIPERDEEVDIEWEETYTVTVTRTATVTLRSGYGESEIDEAARRENGNSDADRSDVLQAVRDGNYESCDFVDDSAQES